MPVSKSRRKGESKAAPRGHSRVLLTSKEYRELLTKLYVLADKVATIQNFLGAVIENSQKTTAAAEGAAHALST